METIRRLLCSRLSHLVLVLGILADAGVARAGVNPLWQELGGSASGDGVSRTPSPRAVFEGTVAVGADGRPVVVYTDYADINALQGGIIVKRWTGTAWELLSHPAGLAVGYAPQVRVAADGAIYVAWLNGISDPQVRLRVRIGSSAFTELGGSDTPGIGVSGRNVGIAAPFSLALDAAGRPMVAFPGVAKTGILSLTTAPALVDGTTQVYVRRWTGSAWEFLGSGYTGGGASQALSFRGAIGDVVHDADTPSLTVDSSGAPVVAFTYYTTLNGQAVGNTDAFVRRWTGSAWTAVGPAVPAGDTAAGRGGAAGVTNTTGGSFNASLAAGPGGRLALAWEEDQPTGEIFVRVRLWNGTAWSELGGSATGTGFNEPDSVNLLPSIGIGPDGRPIVVWEALGDLTGPSQIFVRRWNGVGAWDEVGTGSARADGISAAAGGAFGSSLALTPAGGAGVDGAPTVAWIDIQDEAGQVFLRQLFSDATVALSVQVTGNGTVTSDPNGVQCTGGSCTAGLPPGTTLTLVQQAAPGWKFSGWTGYCAGTGSCTVVLTQARSVTARFDAIRQLTLTVAVPAGTSGQGTIGAVEGPGGTCAFGGGSACTVEVLSGASVTLKATPAPGNRFLSWSGGPCSGQTSATCSFTVTTAGVSTTALFRGITAVTVAKAGNGAGTITAPGIACGTDCGETVFTGTVVSLTPTPATGSVFAGWSGDPCSATLPGGVCQFTASGSSKSFMATFRLKKRLAVSATGTVGFVTSSPAGIDCGGAGHTACGVDYDYGTTVVLTPTPGADSRLSAWSGCSSVSGSLCTVLMTANRTVTGTFVAARTLSVSASGNGSGRIVSTTPPGLTCVNNCSVTQRFTLNTSVVLTPQPAAGTSFRWTGGNCTGSGGCTTVMSANRSAVGQFTLNRFSLSVTARASGKVVNTSALPGGVSISCGSGATACGGSFDYGTPVSLQATPNAGFVFTSWSGTACVGSTSPSCSFTLRASTTATPTSAHARSSQSSRAAPAAGR